jgi:serine protease Do
MNPLASSLVDSTTKILQYARRSLAVLQNGRHGIGAGVVWSYDKEGKGLILTNHHIISRSGQIKAVLEGGVSYPARVLSTAPEIDLALLSVEAKDLPKALIADSRNLRVGELVFAIGHPWGLPYAVTAGLISSLSNTKVRGRRGEIEIIRSDARLAPGNSGGPLVNANGAVVGINTMIVGGDQGIALPSHIASEFVENSIGE